MSSYRSAYENYYKNINNIEKNKKDKNRYSMLNRKIDNSPRSSYGLRMNNKTITNFFIKRVIQELTGATILLLFFVGLKYIPTIQVQQMHANCKQALAYNFNYDECIDAFNEVEIGTVKGEDLRVGDFAIKDLKMENLKAKASSFMEYFKNNIDMQN